MMMKYNQVMHTKVWHSKLLSLPFYRPSHQCHLSIW